MTNKEIDKVSGTETTGHEWDGIKELNTPLPRWWLWTFYGTVIWSLGYVIAYPAIPLISEATSGVLGYSSRAELSQEMDAAAEASAGMVAEISQTDIDTIISADEMARFARAGGESAFKVYCSQCHGSGAAGFPGYPNLNDDEWIWGGTPEEIYATIAHGVRNDDDPQAHFSMMPAFGDILSTSENRAVARYAAFLGDLEGGENTIEGAEIYASNCASCHGAEGGGNQQLGAPPLGNAIWLYAGDYEAILSQVQQPRHGVMPAWLGRLDETTVKQLAVYVHSLGGGQ